MSLHTPFGPRREPPPAVTARTASFVIPPHAEPGDATRAPATRVLIVDGDALSCAELGRWLNRRGHAVALACSHTSADEMRAAVAFDLIICDAGAPPHHHHHWIERLLGSAACPVVLVATQPTLELAMRAANLPLAGCLTKPLDYSALEVLLARLLPAPAR